MIYLSGVVKPALLPYLDAGRVGMIKSPAQGNRVRAGWTWAADNGCFGADSYPGDDGYLRWLARHPVEAALFAVAPDVPFDWPGTLARSRPMLEPIRGLGYPVALAVQNDATPDDVPWDRIDVVFIGGDTAWKTGHEAQQIATRAKHLGKWVHMGRVNSIKRLNRARVMGADSCDGTFLKYGHAEKMLPQLAAWVDHVDAHPVLPVTMWAP